MYLTVGSENVHCRDDQFCCDSNRCITWYWVCDGDKDYSDGTDDDPKECVNTTCSVDCICYKNKNGEAAGVWSWDFMMMIITIIIDVEYIYGFVMLGGL
jgi:hypothetical protein